MFRSSDIDDLARRRPFRPFRIVTSSGETYEVRHPELIMIGDRDVSVGTMSAKDPTHYRRVDHISLLHVTAVEIVPTTETVASDADGQDE